MRRRKPWSWSRDPLMSSTEEVAGRDLRAWGRDDPLWPGQLATLTALVLYVALPQRLTPGPGWPLPVAEAAALAGLILATRRDREMPSRRGVAIGLVLVAALANLVSLGLLAGYLISGGHAAGADLVRGGVLIWATDLLLFTVLYWELDRGGPVGARMGAKVAPDFLFPQMTDERYGTRGWQPGFGDYLYVSLTNQTAFSPTDTLPLTLRVKALMGIQGVAALIITGVILARAVNILTD